MAVVGNIVNYVRTVWKNWPEKTTKITAERLNNMEQGIVDCRDACNQINAGLADAEEDIKQQNSNIVSLQTKLNSAISQLSGLSVQNVSSGIVMWADLNVAGQISYKIGNIVYVFISVSPKQQIPKGISLFRLPFPVKGVYDITSPNMRITGSSKLLPTHYTYQYGGLIASNDVMNVESEYVFEWMYVAD